MRLIALELENFRQYAHAQVAFEDGITAIVGANGAGKTTLVEAILWALYGTRVLREGTETLRFLWSQGGAKVRVTLEFELGNRRYRIRRTPTEAEIAQLNADGTWLPLARGTSVVNDRVLQLLGMNPLQFQTSFCARQKELEFMAYTPQKRREEISRMLGYERITEAFDQVSVVVRALQAEVDGLRQSLGDPQSLMQELQNAETRLQQIEAELGAQEAELTTATAERDAAKAQLDAQTALREQYLELNQQYALLQKDYEHAHQRVEELRTRWEALKAAHERYKAIEADARRYRELAKELKALEQLAQAEQQRAELRAQQNALQQQQTQLQAEHTALQNKKAELDALQPRLQQAAQLQQQLQRVRQLAQRAAERARLEAQIQSTQQQIDALRPQVSALEAQRQEVQSLQRSLQQAQHAIAETEKRLQHAMQTWNQQRAEADAEVRSLHGMLEQQRARIAQLESLGEEGVCPTCGQPLGEAYHDVLQHAYAEMQATETALRSAQQRLQQLQQEPEEVRLLRTQLSEHQHKRDALHQQLAQQQAHLRQLEAEQERLESLEATLEQLRQRYERIPMYDPAEEQRLQSELDALQPCLQQAQQLQGELRRLPAVERELQQLEQRLTRLQAQIDALPTGYDAHRHAQLRQEAERLLPAYEEALELQPLLKEQETLRAQIKQARAELEAKQAQRDALAQQIEQLHYSEDAYLQAAHAYQAAEQRVNALERALAALRAEHSSQMHLRNHLRAQLEQLEQRQQLLREKERELLMHQTLRKALQEFRTELNARLRPLLASIATEFLSTLTNGRYTELDIDEEYRFTLIDEGHRKAVISGGEEDIVNLSLRLALARLITERAGQPLSLLILDEVFASLDAERRQNVMELLNNLRTWFNQILVISHFEEINEAADRCLRVRRNPLTRASEIVEPDLPSMALMDAEP